MRREPHELLGSRLVRWSGISVDSDGDKIYETNDNVGSYWIQRVRWYRPTDWVRRALYRLGGPRHG